MTRGALYILSFIIYLCSTTMAMEVQQVASHSAIWIDVGKVYTTTSYAHLHIPIKTDTLRKRQAFMKSINQRFQVVNIPRDWPETRRENAKARLHDLKRFVGVTTEDTIERIGEAIKATHPNSTRHRSKRQVVTAIALGIAAGVITGVIADEFSPDTVGKVVQESQDVISKTVEENIISIHNQAKDIKQLNYTIAALINKLEETLWLPFPIPLFKTKENLLTALFFITPVLTILLSVATFGDAYAFSVGDAFPLGRLVAWAVRLVFAFRTVLGPVTSQGIWQATGLMQGVASNQILGGPD